VSRTSGGRIVKTFSIVDVIAVAVQAAALIALHLLPTGYDPKRDAVSDYGIGRYRGLRAQRAPDHDLQPEIVERFGSGQVVTSRTRSARSGSAALFRFGRSAV
jgi:hypothetical protein